MSNIDTDGAAVNPLDRPLTWTLFPTEAAQSKTETTSTLREIAELARTSTAPAKQSLPWLKLATFGEKPTQKGSLRNNANVVRFDGIEADYDGEHLSPEQAADMLRAAGIAAVVYTSPSHTDARPRWRVLCPLSQASKPDMRNLMVARLNGILGGVLAPESFTLSQSYYYGSVSSNPAHRVLEVDGRFIDLSNDSGIGKIWPPKTSAKVKTDTSKLPPCKTPHELARRALDDAKTLFDDPQGDRHQRILAATKTCARYVKGALLDRDMVIAEISEACKKSGRVPNPCEVESALDGAIEKAEPYIAAEDEFDGETPDTAEYKSQDAEAIAALVDDFNSKYMVVNEAGKALIYAPRKDVATGRVVYDRMRPDDLKLLYQNDPIMLHDEAGKPKRCSRVVVWLNDRRRRQFIGGVKFDPSNQVSDDVLNLWRGFHVEPKKGTWWPLQLHMHDVVCSGNGDQFDYLMSWLAYMIQHPEIQGEVAVVMRGVEGCGKGILARAVKLLMGQHGLAIANAKHLVGNFNLHLRDCVFLFADEAFFAGDKQHIGVLKSLITEPYLTVEGKYMNAAQSPNFLHVMMASNESWVVPASLEARRFFVLDVPADRVGDYEYFQQIQHQLGHGGYEAMLYDLLHRDLSGFNVRQVPQTKGLQEQKKLSLPTEVAWWVEVLQRGYVYQSRFSHAWLGEWHNEMTTDLLFASYLHHADDVGERRPLSREAFGMFMADMKYRPRRLTDAPITETPAALTKKERPTGYKLGSLEEARALFTAHTKLAISWQGDAAIAEAFDNELQEEGFIFEPAESGP